MFKDTSTRTGNMPFKVDHNTPQAADHLAERMVGLLSENTHFHKIVIVCIGTDRSTGDALGPLVGSKLSTRLSPAQAAVYGTLESPVHAVNLKDTIQEIENTHVNPFVIAVDACLGQLSSVGLVTLANGPLKPGAGVNKVLPEVGHIHLTGIVNVGGFMEYFVLQNTRLSVVMRMADTIADSLTKAISAIETRPFPVDLPQPIQERIENKRSNLFRFL
ncbi:MAG: spore protease YyaC, partial [Tumebacillaceae bacterium]